MNPPLMTPRQVASRLSMSVRTVYEALAPGGWLHELRIDIGNKAVRIDPIKLEDLIAKGGIDANS